MLFYEKGNLLTGKYDIFCHQVNCQKRMGSGIAKQIRNLYPEVYEAYMRKTPKLGTVLAVFTHDRKLCVNMYSQDRYGTDKRYTDYDAFKKCLSEIKDHLSGKSENLVIAFPFNIGCGLAGGDWNVVKGFLEEFSNQVKQKVVIVSLL